MAFQKRKKAAGAVNELGIDPKDLTLEQRRELFIKRKAHYTNKDDFRILKAGCEETLVPFNRLSFDHALKLYGLAGHGTVYHIHGDEGSAKTTIAADICVQYQKQTSEGVAYFDFERRLNPWYVRGMGLDEDLAYIERPDSVEVGVQKAVDFMNQGVRLFVFDSIPRMLSKVKLEDIESGEAFKVQPGTHARVIKQFYDIILPWIASVDGTLIMVNQTRSRIEMTQEAAMAAKGYSTVTNLNYTLPGGKANRFAASVMVENRLARAWKPGAYKRNNVDDPFVMEAKAQHGEEYIALEIAHRTLKNTVSGTGYRTTSSFVRPGRGVDENMSTRRYARDFNLIFNHGKKYVVGESYDNPIKVFDGKDAAIKALTIDEDPELLVPLRALVAQKFVDNDASFQIEVSDDVKRLLSGEEDEYEDESTGKLAAEDVTDDELTTKG